MQRFHQCLWCTDAYLAPFGQGICQRCRMVLASWIQSPIRGEFGYDYDKRMADAIKTSNIELAREWKQHGEHS